MNITFVTTTSHGTWLPGDMRGYVHKGVTLPGDPWRLELSRRLLKTPPVFFSPSDRDVLFESLLAACDEFECRLSDAAVEAWHLHWIVGHEDSIEKMVGRLKTRMRQALSRGRIWTEGYCGEPLFNDAAIEGAQQYIARHDGCRITDGRIIEMRRIQETPGRAKETPGRAKETPGRAGG
jgi:hypothetical protein